MIKKNFSYIRKGLPVLFWFILSVIISIVCAGFLPANDFSAVKKISVVMDDNYPPFVFRGDDGVLKGILIDQWKLFEEKTGIDVTIHAMDWGAAQRKMAEGNYDVIDTMFYNPPREKIYDFTRGYVKIDVPLYIHKDISGIADLSDLSGFLIGVKGGDNVIDVLRSNGLNNFVEFSSYKEMILNARDGKLKIFTVDRPPAHFYMNKYGVADLFRETKPIYTGEFHRGVLKGNHQILELINEGFSQITDKEYKAIEERWYGKPLISESHWKIAGIVFSISAGIAVLLAVWNFSLRRSVHQRTAELLLSTNEKETLLGELYHRTKNNMQVISSLISLQESKIDNEDTRVLLKELQNKIFSMSLVHQMLYKSKNLYSINFSDYIKELAALVIQSYTAGPERIKLNLILSEINISIRSALPCGLVINELLTNSIKYAYPEMKTGTIYIALEKEGDSVKITIKDDGIGAGVDFDHSQSAGIGLQSLLAIEEKQLKGSISFDYSEGFACEITFRDRE